MDEPLNPRFAEPPQDVAAEQKSPERRHLAPAVWAAGALASLVCCLAGLWGLAALLQARSRAAHPAPTPAATTQPAGATATLPRFATATAHPPLELRPMRPQPGYTPPDFTLTSVGGQVYTLSDYYGRPLLINVFTSWCGPCRAEMPAIQAAYEQHHPRGLAVLAVNATRDDYRSEVIDFAREFGLTFPVLLDESGDVARAYRVTSYPTSLFVSVDAVIAEVVYGSMSAAALERHLDGILP